MKWQFTIDSEDDTMHKNGILLVVFMIISGILYGCQANMADANMADEIKHEKNLNTSAAASEDQIWEEFEWLDITLQLPETTDQNHYQTTFQSNGEISGLSDMELTIHNWDGTWSVGNYHMEYYETTVDPETAPLINVPLVDHLIEEYSLRNIGDDSSHENIKETIQLENREIYEMEITETSEGQVLQKWEYVRDPYNRWRLSVSVQKDFAEDIFDHIRRSFDIKKFPEEIDKINGFSWGDIELNVPFTLYQTVSNERFSEIWGDDPKSKYHYTVNVWEGEENGADCLLRYYSVESENETLSSYFTPSHTWTYSEHEKFGMEAESQRIHGRTYTGGEHFLVRDGTYPKEIYRSYGYMNGEERIVQTWSYIQNPYDVWYLEILAPKDQAAALFQEVEGSIKVKSGYGDH